MTITYDDVLRVLHDEAERLEIVARDLGDDRMRWRSSVMYAAHKMVAEHRDRRRG